MMSPVPPNAESTTTADTAAANDLDADYPYKARPAPANAQRAAVAEKQRPVGQCVLSPADWLWEGEWNRAGNTALWVLLYALFAACDATIVVLAEYFSGNDWGALCVYSAAGAIFAQGGLLAAVLVFSGGALWRRLAVCWCLVVVFWFCWALGYGWEILRGYGSLSVDFSDFRFAALALPLAFLAIQAPLWWLRVYRGWRLIHGESGPSRERPPSILDYLIGTAIVAVSLALARVAPDRDFNSTEYWAGWCLFCGSAAAISLFSLPLALWLILQWRRWRLGFLLFVFYGGAATTIGLAGFEFAVSDWPRNAAGMSLWDACGIVTTFVAFAAALGTGLMLLRSRGYALLRGQRAS